jgi:hypothetical protein
MLDNLTRWLSSYLLLLSFKKTYDRNAFAEDNPCPISQAVVEKYLQILQPAYEFNLVMQRTKSTISDVIPSLKIMISKWKRMNVSGVYRNLCNLLISAFEYKFQYEVNSNVYHVATVLDSSMLNNWYD